MTRRKTHEEFVAEVEALVGDEYTVLGSYVKNDGVIFFKHDICGEVLKTTPSNFLYSAVRCKQCSKEKSRGQSNCKYSELFIKEVNDDFEVLGEYVNAKSKISVKHRTCGFQFTITPDHLKRRKSCPKCSMQAKADNRKISIEEFTGRWSPTQLTEYRLIGELNGIFKKTTFAHIVCGNTFSMTPANFQLKKGCPECAKIKRWDTRGRRTTEEYKIELFGAYGEEFTVESEYKGVNSKISIAHTPCGKSRWVDAGSVLKNGGCPYCNESKGERKIRKWLLSKGVEFDAQLPIKYHKQKQPLFLDFYVGGVAIEFDGEQHYVAKEFFGGEVGLCDVQRRDRVKDKYCVDNGIPLIRIPYWDFGIIDAILTEKLLPLLNNASY